MILMFETACISILSINIETQCARHNAALLRERHHPERQSTNVIYTHEFETAGACNKGGAFHPEGVTVPNSLVLLSR